MYKIFQLVLVFPTLLLLLTPFQATAEVIAWKDSAADIYQSGIQSYQKGKLTKAQTLFLQALEKSPDNKFILYNLGLTDFQLNQRGRAIGAWRKALYIDPNFSLARQAYAHALKKMNYLHSNSLTGWESFRQNILTWLNFNLSLAVTALFFLFTGLFLIRYWAQRRNAFLNELPSPKTPYIGLICSLFLLISIAIATAKAYDNYFPRATITTKKVDILSGPHPEDASLFELLEGHEVIIKQTNHEWAQVTYPGGLTGWVQRDLLFHSSGRKPW